MAKLKFPDRDPRDLSDNTFDWTDFLANGAGADQEPAADAVIADATVTVVEGDDLEITGTLVGPKSVTVDLAGGTVGKTYVLACEVTLVDGRRFNRAAKVAVKDL